LAQVARIFERLLEGPRREDGRRWGGAELERATGGVVTRSYVTNLRKGRIENPGLDKLAAMARAMGFAPRYGSRRIRPPRIEEERQVPTVGSRTGPSAYSKSSGTPRPGEPTPAPRSPA
jgi:hypothetical protein